MSNYYGEDDWWDDDDCEVNEDDERAPCSPLKCGDCWLGDNLCQKELDALEAQESEFEELYVAASTACPVCGVLLTQYSIPADEMWVWPGVWPNEAYYSPMIALNIFAIYGAPKGEVHSEGEVHHIWVGEGKHRRENLIRLTGSLRVAHQSA